MRVARGLATGAALALAVLLGACGSWSEREDHAPGDMPDLASIPDAVPRAEPLSRYGNMRAYVVHGVRYHTRPSAAGFIERGLASWYGAKFHGRRTSSGEPYDMYAMTAAHRELPLPSYVRVTNLRNRRAVVVRVNDRGPFHDDRVIDLSYTAALKLDMVRDGTAPVEVRVLLPDDAAPAPAQLEAATGDVYVQAGAFSLADSAVRLGERLESALGRPVAVEPVLVDGQRLHRVRIGPLQTVDGADRLLADLDRLGVADARIIID